jgi:PhzF family phenazine biosynthesis protein
MRLKLFTVDAFTSRPFKGNPAAVCSLEHPLDKPLMQKIAAEENLSETAFVHPIEKKTGIYSLRWFTPATEVPLCGHATLATSAVLFNELGKKYKMLRFKTKSGELVARKVKTGIMLDFPADPPVETHLQRFTGVLSSLGIRKTVNVLFAWKRNMLLVHLSNHKDIVTLKPDFGRLLKSMPRQNSRDGEFGIIVTAKGQPPYDFISRFFAPCEGVNEDPVTGAAHTVLAPYWSNLLGKNRMRAYQASKRGGELTVMYKHGEDRVYLVGKAVIISRGEFTV